MTTISQPANPTHPPPPPPIGQSPIPIPTPQARAKLLLSLIAQHKRAAFEELQQAHILEDSLAHLRARVHRTHRSLALLGGHTQAFTILSTFSPPQVLEIIKLREKGFLTSSTLSLILTNKTHREEKKS